MRADVRSNAADLRGLARLAVDATRGVTTVVEQMHGAIGAPPLGAGRTFDPTGPLRRRVYRQIHRTMATVGGGIDRVLAGLTPLLAASVPGRERDALQAALNGVFGDHLAATGNPLAIEMGFRVAGHRFSAPQAATLAMHLPAARPDLLVLVHGSSMSDRQWRAKGHDHGVALAEALAATPIYLHYNTGLHVATNGAEFAARLDALVAAWPVPVESITLVGYSMGGLVARSACQVAEAAGMPWRTRLSQMAFIGTPHHGAPLERAGNWIDALIGVSRYSAPLGALARIRSAGITDLRFGSITPACQPGPDRFAWAGDRRARVPLPADVACFAVAGRLSDGRFGDLRGDGLVAVSSALGRHPAHDLAIPASHTRIVDGASHLDLLADQRVYAALEGWLAG